MCECTEDLYGCYFFGFCNKFGGIWGSKWIPVDRLMQGPSWTTKKKKVNESRNVYDLGTIWSDEGSDSGAGD